MHTSHGRLCTCGQYIEPSNSRYEYHRLGSRPVGQLLYRDPDPGQPILCFGVNSHPLAGAEPVWEKLDSVDCPIHRDSISYSHASLENVDRVQCFMTCVLRNNLRLNGALASCSSIRVNIEQLWANVELELPKVFKSPLQQRCTRKGSKDQASLG